MVNDFLYKKILIGLLEKNEVSYYYFHLRFAIGPGELIIAINELNKSELIKVTNNLVSITPKGRKYLFANKKSYFSNEYKPWLEIPEYMKVEGISLEESYYPIDFDLKFLEKLERE